MLDLSNICWNSPSIHLMRRQELSRTAGGVARTKDMGPALWRASLTSYPMPLDEADRLKAQLYHAQVETVLIRASDFKWQRTHKGDLDGVSVGSVVGGKVTLNGLPVVLAEGSRLSVDTGNGYEFFQVLDATDQAGGFRVVPEIRAVAEGMPVHLTPPVLEVLIEPGTIDVQSEGVTRRRVSFSGTQVIR